MIMNMNMNITVDDIKETLSKYEYYEIEIKDMSNNKSLIVFKTDITIIKVIMNNSKISSLLQNLL